ncbi:MAG: ribonuclease D [Sphingobacteriia bacterium]|nr:ribonuclease D [Sphingobacteriia bacterium]
MSLIETQDELNLLCDILSHQEAFGIDTEFTKKSTYYPQLSLIQFGGKDYEYAVDLKQPLNFKGLEKILANPKIIKIIHAAKQDLQGIKKFFNIDLKNVFDTQIAATFTGLGDHPSYGTLCEKLLDVKICKKTQFSNWEQRPLTEQQIVYALIDVRHLTSVYEILYKKLTKQNRLEWFEEEMKNLEKTEDNKYLWVKYNQAPKSGKDYALLKDLLFWRMEIAKKNDIAPNLLVNNDIIVELIENNNLINSEAFLKLNEGFKKELIDLFTLEPTLNDIEEFKKISALNSNQNLKSLLRQILLYIADKLNLPGYFIASKDDIFITLLKGINETKIGKGWRYKVFGEVVQLILEK